MKLKFNVRVEVKIIAALIGVSCLIAFGNRKQNQAVCHDIVVALEDAHDNYFVSKADILKIIEDGGKSITGKKFNRIDLRTLEHNLETNKYIADAQLYGNVKGTLIAKVRLRRPIARLLYANSPDVYVATDGALLPTSDTFSSRTLLVSGHIVKKINSSDNIYRTREGQRLMKVLRHINKTPFWQVQITQLDFNNKGKMIMLPQVTGQRIEFGALTDIEAKFKKLMIFYKEILPQKGWTQYSRVNVEYENQIIAE